MSAAFFALAFIELMARSRTDVGRKNKVCHSKTIAATSAAAVGRNSTLQSCAKVFLCKLVGDEEEGKGPIRCRQLLLPGSM